MYDLFCTRLCHQACIIRYQHKPGTKWQILRCIKDLRILPLPAHWPQSGKWVHPLHSTLDIGALIYFCCNLYCIFSRPSLGSTTQSDFSTWRRFPISLCPTTRKPGTPTATSRIMRWTVRYSTDLLQFYILYSLKFIATLETHYDVVNLGVVWGTTLELL